jgi:hypothetical protein
MRCDVLVKVFSGAIDDIRVLPHDKAEEEWDKWAKEKGYKDYESFIAVVNEGEVKEELRWYERIEIEGEPDQEQICYYVSIYDLKEQIPCKTSEEAEAKAKEINESYGEPAVIQVEEGTEADYDAHFGEH